MILTGAARLDSLAQFVTVIILFLFVLGVTYFVTRWISGFQKTQMIGTNTEIVDTLRISASKYLQIIRVGDKYFAIAVCKDTVTMLTEVSKDSLDLEMGSGNTNLSFREVLDKIKDSATVLQNTKK